MKVSLIGKAVFYFFSANGHDNSITINKYRVKMTKNTSVMVTKWEYDLRFRTGCGSGSLVVRIIVSPDICSPDPCRSRSL